MSRKADTIYCNCCGRAICAQAEQERKSFLAIRKEWGYFSKGKDGEIHSMDICEPCYDKLVQNFAIAPQKEQITELV